MKYADLRPIMVDSERRWYVRLFIMKIGQLTNIKATKSRLMRRARMESPAVGNSYWSVISMLRTDKAMK